MGPEKLGRLPRSFGTGDRNCSCSTRTEVVEVEVEQRNMDAHRTDSRDPTSSRRHAGTRHGRKGRNRKSLLRGGYISGHQQISRACGSVLLRLTDVRRSKAAIVMGGEVFLRRRSTLPSYTKHMWVGRKIASSHRKREGWRAALGCVCRGRDGPNGERQCVGSVWMSSGPLQLNGLAQGYLSQAPLRAWGEQSGFDVCSTPWHGCRAYLQ